MAIDNEQMFTVGASYYLHTKEDGKPNVSAIMDDTGLGRDVVKKCIIALETDHKDWLEDYKSLLAISARKELAAEAHTRIRSEFYRFGFEFLRITKLPLLKLQRECLVAAASNAQLNEAEFQVLKIKQFECRRSLAALDKILKMVEGLEGITKSPTTNATATVIVNPEEKKNRFLRLESLQPENSENNGS